MQDRKPPDRRPEEGLPEYTPEDRKGFDWRSLLPILIIVAGLAAYYNSFSGTFLFDDEKHIVENTRIREILPLARTMSGRRPILDLSLAINHAHAMGRTYPDANEEMDSWGFHAVNLGVHLLAAMTLFGVIRRTILHGDFTQSVKNVAPWLALVTALIWVVHPLQTQSVTYLIQRGESLMGLFYLLTLYCVIRGARSPRALWWYAAAVGCCALGMGTKGVMITAPVVILIYDWIFISKSPVEALRRRWGLYACLAATWGILFATDLVAGIMSTSRRGATVGFSYKRVTPLGYAATQIGVIAYYLKLSFWPHPLCLDYAWPSARTVGEVLKPALVVGPLVAGTIWGIVRRPWLGFVGLWFFLILAPTSSIIPIKDAIFEHRMYLPLAAVIIVVVAGVYVGLDRLFLSRSPWVWGRRSIATVLVAVILVLSIYGTARRNRDYQEDLVMWDDVLAKRPGNPRAYLGRGAVLYETGQTVEAERMFAEAVRLKPKYPDALYNLGNALDANGKLDEAIEAYRKSLRYKRRNAKARYNLGNTLKKQDKLDEAIAEYYKALEINPRHVSAHVNLGNSLKLLGRLDEAIDIYHKALRINPNHANTHFNLGDALLRQGKLEEALEEFDEALRRNPNHKLAPSYRDGVLRRLEELGSNSH